MPASDDDDDVTAEELVARALREITPSRFFCGARAIGESPIHPGEKALYTGVDPPVRRATSTGRLLAREVLRNMGVKPAPILRGEGGAPLWPTGFSGSIAHDDEFAVCVIGSGPDCYVGVDVEPASPLPEEVLDNVLVTAAERAVWALDLVAARLIFCAKEAVYKTCYPVEHRFYEFDEIRWIPDPAAPPPLAAGTAGAATGPVELVFGTSSGRHVTVVAVREPRLLAVATATWLEGLYTR
ncbi:MAG: 4'-phosphopantetheinyl transferase superfamily protein [Deltaproteobacteria bacterium]|nr:4'-phosphopantetheinyl transferase superfamily protein [Deltaproteobacteria bacterium]